jgi:hypothetical protein
MTRSAAWTLGVLLAGLLIAGQAWIAAVAPGLTNEAVAADPLRVLPLIGSLIVPTIALLWLGPVLARRLDGRAVLAVVVLVGLLMRLAHLGAPPALELDHFRYLWEGALVAHGLDPYAVAPQDAPGDPARAVLALEGHSVWANILLPMFRSIYPGTAQLAFGLAHRLAPWSVEGLRLVMLAGEFITLGFLIVLLRATGRPTTAAAFYWCNPLVVLVLFNQAHVDALIPGCLLAVIWLLRADTRSVRQAGLAGLALAVAVGVKLWPVVLAPLVLRRLLPGRAAIITFAAMFGAASLLLIAPLMLSALSAGSGLTAYAQGWAMNNGLYNWTILALDTVASGGVAGDRVWRFMAAGTVATLALAVAWRPLRDVGDLAGRMLIVAAAIFFLSPAQFPWYAIWFFPLAVLRLNAPLVAFSALLPLYYLAFALSGPTGGTLFSLGIALAQTLPVLVWLAASRNPRSIHWQTGAT